MGRTAAFTEVDWIGAAATVAQEGWVRLQAALDSQAVDALRTARKAPWRDLPPEEGVVHQHGAHSWLPMAECAQGVRSIGVELVSSLSAAGESLGYPPVPPFNEAEWTYYQREAGYITAHRDPKAYGGVIAVFTLFGEARFRVTKQQETEEWTTLSGDVVLLRGYGWPTSQAARPRHEVEPPVDSDRMILTMRFNTRGAGAGYYV